MKTGIRFATVFCLLFTLAGCLPDRIFWSPDGSVAAIITGDQNDGHLIFCDADGVTSESGLDRITHLEWLPEGRGILVGINRTWDQWSEIDAELLDFERARVAELIERISAGTGSEHGVVDWINAQRESKALGPNQLLIVAHYLAAHPDITLPAQVSSALPPKEPVEGVQLVEFEVNGMQLGARRVLGFVTEPAWAIRPSPRGDLALLVYGQAFNQSSMPLKLALLSLGRDGAPVQGRILSPNSAFYPDWSRDGNSVIFAEADFMTTDHQPFSLGKIREAEVFNKEGVMQWEPPMTDHAIILMSEQTCIRTLSDGQILFSGPEGHFPSGIKDGIQRLGIFSLDPERRPTVSSMLSYETSMEIGNFGWTFEVNPEERRVALVAEDGRVAIVTLADGSVDFTQPEADADSNLRALPKWRAQGDLCLCLPLPETAENGAEAELVLYRDGHKQSLSANWPESWIKGFLD